MFVQLLGALCLTGLFALGVTMGLFGDIVGREPSIIQMIMAIPSTIMNPKFLYVWGAILALTAGAYAFQSIRKR